MSKNVITAMTLLLTACGNASSERYPARYEAAALVHPGAPVPGDAATRFATFFTTLHEPGIGARVEALYAPDVYFSDTLFVCQDRDPLRAHFERLQASGRRVTVAIDDAITSGTTLYVRWRMSFPLNAAGTRQSETIGMTMLRYDANQHIVFQQDFWDSTEGVYRHLPVLGWGIDAVAARLGGSR